jgi:hypothetical protein
MIRPDMATNGPDVNRESVVITLDRNEALFLITVLKSSTAILTALLALQKSLPEPSLHSRRT